MKIILRQNMDALGLEGDIVDVANGYARNYLIPKGIALEENKQNIKLLETQRGKIEVKKLKAKEHAEKISIKGGFFSGSLLDTPAVMELANIPDKHTLFTQMAGLFQSPLRDVTVVTGQVVARVLYAINNYKEKLEKGDGEG